MMGAQKRHIQKLQMSAWETFEQGRAASALHSKDRGSRGTTEQTVQEQTLEDHSEHLYF